LISACRQAGKIARFAKAKPRRENLEFKIRMKVALIHDYLIRFGGAERVLLELAKMFPEAPIYTFLYDQEKMGEWFSSERVRPSFLQKFPAFLRRRHKWLLPLMPIVPETFDLREFDLVISSSSAFAKGVVVRPKTIHISYCHNAARFLWDYSTEYLSQQKLGFYRQILVDIIFNYLRLWDRSASKRVDYFVANSKATASRIKKYYNRDSKVIYPPVNLAAFDGSKNDFQKHKISPSDENFTRQADSLSVPQKQDGTMPTRQLERFENHIFLPLLVPKDYFLIVSQLTPYKKIDVAVEAFNKLGLPLIIIGEGSQKKYLQSIAKDNIKILGWLVDEETAEYYKNCFAFIFSGEDDFGIAPVEAMSWGKPVLALCSGGARETVLPGMTGEFFEATTPEVLADGVRRLRDNYKNYSPLLIRKWAEKFSTERFRQEFMEFVKKVGYSI